MIKENLLALRQKINETARRAGRQPEEIELVLVTKNVGLDQIMEAYEAGERKFGENRVQEFLEKCGKLPQDIEWHLIGHLQTNKVKSVIDHICLIHSLDSLRLAQEMERRAKDLRRTVQVLIQVNISGEATKFGVTPEDFSELLEGVLSLSHVKVLGLMGIGPVASEEKVRSCFRSLASLRDEWVRRKSLDLKYLSMGMTSDFEIAIEEGANLLRIGTAIFGERKEIDAR